MAHIPINHPLRPVYRALAGLAGLYVLLFGIIGFAQTRGLELFAQQDLPWVLGLRTNPAFSYLSIVAGIVLLGGVVVGGNVHRSVNLAGGLVFLVAGIAMMTLLQTDANIFGFSMVNCIVSFVIGIVLLAAGLYGKVGTPDRAQAEEAFRRGDRVPS
jgi:uncharacterized protein DUF4383